MSGCCNFSIHFQLLLLFLLACLSFFVFVVFFGLFWVFVMGSDVAQQGLKCFVAEVSLKLLISLPLPPECHGGGGESWAAV